MNPGCLREYCYNKEEPESKCIEGSILDFTYEEVKAFNLKPSKQYTCPHNKLDASIPKLKDVLSMAKASNIMLKIELKGPNTEVPTLKLVEKEGMVDRCHFSSFYHERVAKIRELRPQRTTDGAYRIKTACLFRNPPPKDFVKRSIMHGASEVHLRYDACSKENIRAVHDAGLESMAWFRSPLTMQEDAAKLVDVGDEDEAMYQTVMNSGVQSLCVNKPDVLLKHLARIDLKA